MLHADPSPGLLRRRLDRRRATPLAQLPAVLLIVGLAAVLGVFVRLLIMWLYNGTGGSILIAALFHSAFNMSTGQKITPELIPGLGATALNLLPWAVAAVVAVVVAVSTKGRLGAGHRAAPGGQPAAPERRTDARSGRRAR